MGIGPIVAVPKALKKANLTLDDISVVELNEAFASQALACIKTLEIPMEKVNPNGGAMALGHHWEQPVHSLPVKFSRN